MLFIGRALAEGRQQHANTCACPSGMLWVVQSEVWSVCGGAELLISQVHQRRAADGAAAAGVGVLHTRCWEAPGLGHA